MGATDEALKDLLGRYRANRRVWGEQCVQIRDKAKQLVPFRPNPAQLRLEAVMDRQLADTGQVKVLVPKARQLGVSQYLCMRGLHRAMFYSGTFAAQLAHRDDASRNLFSKVKDAFWSIPPASRPLVKTDNASQLQFAGLDSGYQVSTVGAGDTTYKARAAGTGRSLTVHWLHLSEVAWYAGADEVVATMLETVPNEYGTEVALESTGNGIGGAFDTMCLAAAVGELPGWETVFLPWMLDRGYQATPPKGWRAAGDWQEYQQQHRLSDRQAWWAYRHNSQMAALRPGTPVDSPSPRFRQEMPATLNECFQASTEHQLIDTVLIEQAQQRLLPVDEHAMPVLGVDIGRNPGHGDPSVIIDRRGRRAGMEVFDRFYSDDLMFTLGRVVQAVKKTGARRVYVDVTGIGAGVVDRLVELGVQGVVGVRFGSTEDVIEPDRYVNKRTEMYCRCLEWLQQHGGVQLVADVQMLRSLASVQRGFDGADKSRLEPKDKTRQRLKRSPDEADALVCTFAEDLHALEEVMAAVHGMGYSRVPNARYVGS